MAATPFNSRLALARRGFGGRGFCQVGPQCPGETGPCLRNRHKPLLRRAAVMSFVFAVAVSQTVVASGATHSGLGRTLSLPGQNGVRRVQISPNGQIQSVTSVDSKSSQFQSGAAT
jgi:hypothetical protein